MKTLSRGIGLMVLSAVACGTNAFASFQDLANSVKASGMGGAYVALADESSALFHNPAGLSTLKSPEVSMMYGSPMVGVRASTLNQGYMTAGMPLGNSPFSLGIGMNTFQAPGLLSEYEYSLGAAWRPLSMLAIGAAGTYFYHNYEIASDPLYSNSDVFSNGSSKGAMGVDLGAMLFLTPSIQMGAAMRNANYPDVGLRESDPVARVLALGGMYTWRGAHLQAEIERQDDPLGLVDTKPIWKLGLEVPFHHLMALRAGMNSNALTAGFGIGLGALHVNYAFSMLTGVQAANAGSHDIALSYKMGRATRHDEPRALLGKTPTSAHQPTLRAIREGDFALAAFRLQQALDAHPSDRNLLTMHSRMKAVTDILPRVDGSEGRAVMIKEGVAAYVEGREPMAAVRYLRSAFNQMPSDTRSLALTNLAERAAGVRELTQSRSRDGEVAGFVDQKLHEARLASYDGRYNEAIRRVGEVLEIEPDNIPALQIQGSAFYLMKKYEQARRAWTKVLQLNPNDETVREFMAKLPQ